MARNSIRAQIRSKDVEFLRALIKSSAKKRKQLLKGATNSNLRLLLECVKNILVGNIPISQQKKKQLNRHRYKLRFLASRRNNLKKKLGVLNQTGGSLPAILSVLTPTIVTAIAELIRGRG